jgi:hypothetical protein
MCESPKIPRLDTAGVPITQGSVFFFFFLEEMALTFHGSRGKCSTPLVVEFSPQQVVRSMSLNVIAAGSWELFSLELHGKSESLAVFRSRP